MLSRKSVVDSQHVEELIKYIVVGVICTAIDAFIFYLTCNTIGYRLAMISGFCVSVSLNYYLNVKWAFGSTITLKNGIGVVTAHLFNIFIVRMGLMWFFIDILLLNDEFSFIPTIMISTLTNFVIIKFIVNKL